MAFCPQCGKQIPDGQVCDCTAAVNMTPMVGGGAAPAPAVNVPMEPAVDPVTMQVMPGQVPPVQSAPELVPPVQGMPNMQTIPGQMPGMQPMPAAKPKKPVDKKILFGGIGAAALVLVIVLILVFAGGGSYKDPFNRIIDAVNKKGEKEYLDLRFASLPKDLQKIMKSGAELMWDSKTLRSYNKDTNKSFEKLEDKYSGYKLSFEYESVEKVSKLEMREAERYFRDYYEDYFEDNLNDYNYDVKHNSEEMKEFADDKGYDEKAFLAYAKDLAKYMEKFKSPKVTEGYQIEGRFVLKDGSDEIASTQSGEFAVVKINGEWAIIPDSSCYFKSKKNSEYYSFLSNYMTLSFDDVVRRLSFERVREY